LAAVERLARRGTAGFAEREAQGQRQAVGSTNRLDEPKLNRFVQQLLNEPPRQL
jgi:hypothetical protein